MGPLGPLTTCLHKNLNDFISLALYNKVYVSDATVLIDLNTKQNLSVWIHSFKDLRSMLLLKMIISYTVARTMQG